MSINSDAATMYQLVADNIRCRRKERGWTLKDLSEASGISLGYISEIERGKKDPALPTLIALAKALGACVVFRLEEVVK